MVLNLIVPNWIKSLGPTTNPFINNFRFLKKNWDHTETLLKATTTRTVRNTIKIQFYFIAHQLFNKFNSFASSQMCCNLSIKLLIQWYSISAIKTLRCDAEIRYHVIYHFQLCSVLLYAITHDVSFSHTPQNTHQTLIDTNNLNRIQMF